MNDLKIQSLIEELIITKNDKAVFLDALAVIKKAAYMKDLKKIVVSLKNNLTERFFKPLEVVLSNAKTPADISKFVIKVEKIVNKLPLATIIVSYDPTRTQIKQLSNKIRSYTKRTVITNYLINPDVIGVEINFNGKTYKKTLEEQLTKKPVLGIDPNHPPMTLTDDEVKKIKHEKSTIKTSKGKNLNIEKKYKVMLMEGAELQSKHGIKAQQLQENKTVYTPPVMTTKN